VIDKVVRTLNVRFIDIYAGSNPKQVLYLVNTPTRLYGFTFETVWISLEFGSAIFGPLFL
jgi:hypothetical protein